MKPSSLLNDDFTLTLGGTPFTFHWGIDELIEMQEMLTTPMYVPSVVEMDRAVRFQRLKYVRAMLWAGLRKHHPKADIGVAGELLQQATPAEYKALMDAFGYSVTPDTHDAKALKSPSKKANPRKAQTKRKTGESSSSAPGAAV